MFNSLFIECSILFIIVFQIILSFFVKKILGKMVAYKSQLNMVLNDKKELSQGLNALYHSIEHLEKSFSTIREKQIEGEVQQKTQAHLKENKNTYQYASKLIEMGASLSEVQKTCELKKQEAELLWAIKKND